MCTWHVENIQHIGCCEMKCDGGGEMSWQSQRWAIFLSDRPKQSHRESLQPSSCSNVVVPLKKWFFIIFQLARRTRLWDARRYPPSWRAAPQHHYHPLPLAMSCSIQRQDTALRTRTHTVRCQNPWSKPYTPQYCLQYMYKIREEGRSQRELWIPVLTNMHDMMNKMFFLNEWIHLLASQHFFHSYTSPSILIYTLKYSTPIFWLQGKFLISTLQLQVSHLRPLLGNCLIQWFNEELECIYCHTSNMKIKSIG